MKYAAEDAILDFFCLKLGCNIHFLIFIMGRTSTSNGDMYAKTKYVVCVD